VSQRSSRRKAVLFLWLLLFLNLQWCISCVSAASLEWIRQFGSSRDDNAWGVSADDMGNIYVVGDTAGTFAGPSSGQSDAFVSKYDSAGALLWSRQFGTAGRDVAWDVDVRQDQIYLAGATEGAVSIPNPTGFYDAIVRSYDAGGGLGWTSQRGGNSNQVWEGIAIGRDGDVYLAGQTDDGFPVGSSSGNGGIIVSKMDDNGVTKWIKEVGTPTIEFITDVTVDGLGNLYLSGSTAGSWGGATLGGYDAFVTKFDANGALAWTTKFGSPSNDAAKSLVSDELGNVYVSGSTDGNIDGTNAGFSDAIVGKLDSAGNFLWMRQFGTAAGDIAYGIAADELGGVFVAGSTDGDLAGDSAGNSDVFLAKFDGSGSQVWTKQFGGAAVDVPNGVSSDGRGGIYVSGYTQGSLGTPSFGRTDAFLAKLTEIPEPAAFRITAMAAATIFPWFRRRTKVGGT
jgi:hypothetical protein